MRNNMTYEEAVEELRKLEITQKYHKHKKKYVSKINWGTNKSGQNKAISDYQIYLNKTTDKINLLLSIIHAHKAARKLYAENKELRKMRKNMEDGWMKRSDLEKEIALIIKNGLKHDRKSIQIARTIIERMEEDRIITKMYTSNSEFVGDVVYDIDKSVDFWRSFVEGQSKAINWYAKKNREYYKILKDNGLLNTEPEE